MKAIIIPIAIIVGLVLLPIIIYSGIESHIEESKRGAE